MGAAIRLRRQHERLREMRQRWRRLMGEAVGSALRTVSYNSGALRPTLFPIVAYKRNKMAAIRSDLKFDVDLPGERFLQLRDMIDRGCGRRSVGASILRALPDTRVELAKTLHRSSSNWRLFR